MSGYIDLHCHWVAGIDDGAFAPAMSAAMLRGLREIGFSKVIATPHMRSGMFDNSRDEIEQAYRETRLALAEHDDLPEVGLSAEHHLDDLVFRSLIDGLGLPYPGGKAALIEFPNQRFPVQHARRLSELRSANMRPVLAHPERYRPVWDDIEVLEPLLDGGTVLLLDVAALVGKYGRACRRAAHELLEAGYFYAACSDAHRPEDVDDVAEGIARLQKVAGEEEAAFLLREGPAHILAGTVDDDGLGAQFR